MKTREQRALERSILYYLLGLLCVWMFILAQVILVVVSFFHEGINELFRVYFVPGPVSLALLLWGSLLIRLGNEKTTGMITSIVLFILFFMYVSVIVFGPGMSTMEALLRIGVAAVFSMTAFFLLLKSD